MKPRHGLGAVVLGASLGLISSCHTAPTQETAISEAKIGDVLVISDDTQVRLSQPFRPGTPNGLYDGAVTTLSESGQDQHFEVNAVCSMPDLPGWPSYDNIYGKPIASPSDAGSSGGETKWQSLLRFDGTVSAEGPEASPEWAERLAQNLCRKGDFDDTNSDGQENQKLTLDGQSLDVENKPTTK